MERLLPDDPDILDLETGLPTTPEDVRSQAALRAPPMTIDEYIEFLRRLEIDPEAIRRIPLTIGTPFRLEEGD